MLMKTTKCASKIEPSTMKWAVVYLKLVVLTNTYITESMGKIKLPFGISMKINVVFVEKQVFLQNRTMHLF